MLEVLFSYVKEVVKDEKLYVIKIDFDVEVDKGVEVFKNLCEFGFKYKGFKEGLFKDYI